MIERLVCWIITVVAISVSVGLLVAIEVEFLRWYREHNHD